MNTDVVDSAILIKKKNHRLSTIKLIYSNFTDDFFEQKHDEFS